MKIGKHIYIYEAEGYRDADGKPRNKKHPVGKVDPATGEEIFKPEFLAKLPLYGKTIPTPASKNRFTVRDIKTSTVHEYGATYFLEAIAEQIGLKEILYRVFGNFSWEISALAAYLICTEDPFAYIAHWIEGTETKGGLSLCSQRVSQMLHEITEEDRTGFFRLWSEYRKEREYLALDITSISSWSDLIDDVEWGYNREGDRLAQINLCLLVGEKSGLPVFQTVYSGSLKDVSTFKTTLREASCYTGGKRLFLVVDKGFYSAQNVNLLLKSPEKYGFVLPVPFTARFAKEWIRREKEGIDTPENTYAANKHGVRLVSRKIKWDDKTTLNAHICFNALKAAARKDELYSHVAALLLKAKENHEDEKLRGGLRNILLRKNRRAEARLK
jgi:hypothetical protein